VQSGPLQTQLDYGSFSPGNSISWKECWYPVHGLVDGFDFATEKMAIRAKFNHKDLEVKIISTEKIQGAVCKVFSGKKLLQDKKVNLSPASASTIIFNGILPGSVSISLETTHGEVLAGFDTPLHIPEVKPPVPPVYAGKADDSLTVEELWLKGQKYDRALNRAEARRYYEKALKNDPLHLASLRDLAILDYEAGLYDKASSGFSKALEQVPNDDGIAWYFLGLCHLKKGEMENALHCGIRASRCNGTVSAGFELAGRVNMLLKKFPEAIKNFTKAFESDRNNPGSYHHFLLAMYTEGRTEEALKLSGERIRRYPSELPPRLLESIIEKKLNDKVSEIKSFLGEDDFEIMEAGYLFSNSGLYHEAIQILEFFCVDNVTLDQQNPLVLYELGYLYSKTGNDDKTNGYLGMASKSKNDFIWASRPEEEEALKYAITINPSDALANYQLGNYYANCGRIDEAAGFWDKAINADPSMSIPWRNLAFYYWLQKKDLIKSASCFREAIKVRPLDQTLCRNLAKVLAENGNRNEAVSVLEKMAFREPLRTDIITDLARYKLEMGKYDESIRLLTSGQCYFWDGSTVPLDIYIKANTEKGIALFNNKNFKSALSAFDNALKTPENLHIGRSELTEDSKAWFWKGKTWMTLGKSPEASRAWRTGSQQPLRSEEQNRYIDSCRIMIK